MKKKLLVSLIFLLQIFVINAQSFQESFLGSDFMLYKGSLFKMKEGAISGFGHTFYSNLENCQKMYDDNVIYPDSRYKFNTVSDSLKNRIFRVEEIVNKDGNPFTKGNYFDKPIFILKDVNNEQIIYYKYDKQYEHNFPFLTAGLELDTEVLCAKLERRVDDFTSEIRINSPIFDGVKMSPIIIYKVINGNSSQYYLSLSADGSTLNVGESGLIILFEDGTKLERPNQKIDVEAGDSDFKYKAFISLTETDLEKFTSKKISKYRLYIYDKTINQGEGEKFTHFVKCVLETQ